MEHLGSPYFFFLALGFGFGFLYLIQRGTSEGLPRVGLIDVCIAAILGGVLGGRLLHVVAEPLPAHALQPGEVAQLREKLPGLDPELREPLRAALRTREVPAVWLFLAEMPPGEARREALGQVAKDPSAVPVWLWYRTHPSHIPQFWRGGLAYFGGLVLAVILCVLVTLRHGMPVRRVADLTAPAIILGLVFGRIGCFLGGCCYGEVCEPAWWATQPSWYPPPVGGVARYPTALASSLFALLLFATLHWLHGRRRFAGEVFLAMVVLYAPGRYLIEALRADPRGGAGGLSTTQLLVVVSGVPALALWLWGRARPQDPSLDAPPGETSTSADPESLDPPPAPDAPAAKGVESPPCPNQ